MINNTDLSIALYSIVQHTMCNYTMLHIADTKFALLIIVLYNIMTKFVPLIIVI